MANVALTASVSVANDSSGASPNGSTVEVQKLEKLQQQLKDIKEQVSCVCVCVFVHTLRQNLKIYFKSKN